MKKIYIIKFLDLLVPFKGYLPIPGSSGRQLPYLVTGGLFLSLLFPSVGRAQKLYFSYSYENVTRNIGGGTLEYGDTIEVHALVKVDKTTQHFYYIDTIRQGTAYIEGSLRLVTNEGLNFQGPFSSTANDDRGVYDLSDGIPKLRVNIGTGAAAAQGGVNFGTTSGGGKVTAGDVPKFYGTTLFMVAYRLRITANFGDTIHLTGNYYFDTLLQSNPTIKTRRFNYSGIKILPNTGFCNNFSSASFAADSSFKSGNVQNRALPGMAPGYTKINLGPSSPNDNYYAIANNTSADGTVDNTGLFAPSLNKHRVFGGFWDIIGDHTGATDPEAGNPPVPPGTPGGYMLVVNAAYPTGEAYRDTIKNVCPNTNYEFSAWVRNICGVCGIDKNSNPSYTPGVLPNLTFTINDVDYYSTGSLPHDKKWVKRGFLYKTGPGETQFVISIKNNAAGGGGNDWVLDDIKLASCYPNLIMNPSDTISACAGSPMPISDTVKSYFDNYVNYEWEFSTNLGVSWIPLPSTINTGHPVLENGLWVYYVDTVITPTIDMDGYLIRLKVATTIPNLNNVNCSVDNSQSIYLRVYSTGCSVLDATLLDFYGTLRGGNALLKWTNPNEYNLKQYVIQKSKDGTHFKDVGQLGAGKNSQGSNYAFYDPEGITDLVYYRLRLDGDEFTGSTFSKIIVLYNKNKNFRINVVNPFRNTLDLDMLLPAEGIAEFTLFDIYGNKVLQQSAAFNKGNSFFQIRNIPKLSPGLYLLKTHFNGNEVLNKLIKIN